MQKGRIMAQRLTKGSKRKYGLVEYMPQYHPQPTGDARVPLWQPDGVRYVTKGDFEWLIRNGKIDMAMPEEVSIDSEKAKDPQS